MERVTGELYRDRQALRLRAGLTRSTRTEAPDVVFAPEIPKSGLYWIHARAAGPANGKVPRYHLLIKTGARPATERQLYGIYMYPAGLQEIGLFRLEKGTREIAIHLPETVALNELQLEKFVPPAIPEAVCDYRPPVAPSGHPRIWMRNSDFERIRRNRNHPENRAAWERIRQLAAIRPELPPAAGGEVKSDPQLELALQARALLYVLEQNEPSGREAVQFLLEYFPNLTGLGFYQTRDIGRAIYCAALVYDWCYPLLSDTDKRRLIDAMKEHAAAMEIRYPPFRQPVVIGHGNESQLSQDLLSFAIACYDEDPEPWQFCAYRIFTELVPYKNAEYRSKRHPEGIFYGPFRLSYDMVAAVLLEKMAGRPFFDPAIWQVFGYWQYMRLPDGNFLKDGDGVFAPTPFLYQFLRYSYVAFFTSLHTRDPFVKKEFFRAGGLPQDPVLFAVLNAPELPTATAEWDTSLPLTAYFGPPLGAMVARTAWDNTAAVVEMKGGFRHAFSHSHLDAGAFQLYFGSPQAVDLGEYLFFGTAYDLEFNKRTIAHNTLRVYDPEERFFRWTTIPYSNDGGQRIPNLVPGNLAELLKPEYEYGKTFSAAWGPDATRPQWSAISADLASAYSAKVERFFRRQVFLNSGDGADFIVFDELISARPELVKTWQVSTLDPPTEQGKNRLRWSRTTLDMLLPEKRRVKILSGSDASSFQGKRFSLPKSGLPEATAHRIEVTPAEPAKHDLFLNVFQMRRGEPRPVTGERTADAVHVRVGDTIVIFPVGVALRENELTFAVESPEQRVLILDLAPGIWLDGSGRRWQVEAGKHQLSGHFPAGEQRLKRQEEK